MQAHAQAPPASRPTLFVPPRADSAARVATPPAPLLIPGRPYAPDTLERTRAQVAMDNFLRGARLEEDGNPQAAMASYRNAAALDPAIASVHLRMGRLYEAFGMVADALKSYGEEVKHHPENRDAARLLGLSLARMGESDRAIQQLELLVRRDARDGASWRALGFAYTHARRYKEAERALRSAIALPPADAEEYRDLGVLLAGRGRIAEAKEAYLKAAKLDPRDAVPYVNLGNLEQRAGRSEAALDWYRQAEGRDSSAVFAFRGQVQALQTAGRDAEIGDVYRRWLRRAPDDEGGRLEAVQFFTARGRTDVAMEMARDGVRRAPRSGPARMTMGVALAGSGDARHSLGEFRRAEILLGRTDPEMSTRVRSLIAELRAGAPDSLRAFFREDSVAAELRARPDSLAVPGFAGPRREGR